MRDWWSTANNPFALDIYVNWIWYAAGREPAEEILIVHNLRSKIAHYRVQKVLLSSVMDFAEKFGATRQALRSGLAKWMG